MQNEALWDFRLHAMLQVGVSYVGNRPNLPRGLAGFPYKNLFAPPQTVNQPIVSSYKSGRREAKWHYWPKPWQRLVLVYPRIVTLSHRFYCELGPATRALCEN